MAPRHRITPENLGAWVIKCNPDKTPVGPMLAAGEANTSWCVAGNYRSRLIRPGQRVLFWVVAHPRRGVWGAGRVAGELTAAEGRLHMPVRIPLFEHPVTAAQLQAAVPLRSMEVFRSPQQANPSWVSAAEWAHLEPLLPGTDPAQNA